MTLHPLVKESIRLVGGGMKAVVASPSSREWWGWLAVAALVGLWHYGALDGRISLREGLRRVAPKSIYLSRSVLYDVACIALKFVIFRVVLKLILGVEIEDFVFAHHAVAALQKAIGAAPAAPREATLAVNLLYTFGVFLAFEFGWWTAHWATHKIPVLWAFHKVHHGTTLLNPLASKRVHVLDEALLMAGVGLPAGVVLYLFKAFGYSPSVVLAYDEISVAYLGFIVFGALRHSHIPVSFGRLEAVFASPFMHQFHHSCKTEHVNKNYGYYLSVFDRLFGTAYFPRPGEELVFGISQADAARPAPGFLRMYFLQPLEDCREYLSSGQLLSFARRH